MLALVEGFNIFRENEIVLSPPPSPGLTPNSEMDIVPSELNSEQVPASGGSPPAYSWSGGEVSIRDEVQNEQEKLVTTMQRYGSSRLQQFSSELADPHASSSLREDETPKAEGTAVQQ